MRPYLLALSVIPLTLALAACDSAPKPEAAKPAATPPAAAAPSQPATPAAPAAQPATASATEALKPVIGGWATEPANCGAPVTIAANSFAGTDGNCEISGWTDNGDGTLTAAMSCGSASKKITMTPIFGPQGEGIRMADGSGGKPVTVFRCPKPKAQ